MNSDESDYMAKTMFAGVSHDMFGDLTTISFGYKNGKNDVFRNVKIDGVKRERPRRSPKRWSRRASASAVSQIITKNLVLSGQYEVITDEGFLRSPYRSVRFFIDPFEPGPAARDYPNTRSSNAASVRAKYFLPYRAAIDAMYRFYTDTWGVIGHTGELGYVHPLDTALGGNWIFEGRVRYYTQDSRGFLPGHLPARRLRQFHGARQGTRDLQRHHRRRRRHLRIQDRALPLALQGPAQPALRLHDGRTTTTSATRAYSLGSFGIPPDDPLPPGTEPLYKLERQHLPVLHLRVLLIRGQPPGSSTTAQSKKSRIL